jgi:hypothetical protein
MSFRNQLFSSLAVLGLAACGGSGSTTPPSDNNNYGTYDASGLDQAPYDGPYGVGTGSVIPNFKFMGYPRATLDKTSLVAINLGDFYNPTGTDVYPAGSPYGEGTPKPKAVILDRSAVWCGPCNQEAATEIPAKRQEFASQGGEWFVMLAESSQHNVPATQTDLTNWATKYHLNYPGSIDSKGYLNSIVGQDAYPGNVIVRTKDMKIIKWVAGVPQDDFYQTFSDVLAGKAIPGIDN